MHPQLQDVVHAQFGDQSWFCASRLADRFISTKGEAAWKKFKEEEIQTNSVPEYLRSVVELEAFDGRPNSDFRLRVKRNVMNATRVRPADLLELVAKTYGKGVWFLPSTFCSIFKSSIGDEAYAQFKEEYIKGSSIPKFLRTLKELEAKDDTLLSAFRLKGAQSGPSPHGLHGTASIPKPYVTSVAEAEQVLFAVHSELAQMNSTKYVVIDMEGDLRRKGGASILQLGLPSGKVYLFDILGSNEEILNHGPQVPSPLWRPGPSATTTFSIRELLSSDQVIKVFHDCRADCFSLGLMSPPCAVRNVFDTQTAYCIKHGVAMEVDLSTLVSSFPGIDSHSNKHEVNHSAVYWNTRPLTSEMRKYCEEDVRCISDVYCALVSGNSDEFEVRVRDRSNARAQKRFETAQQRVTVQPTVSAVADEMTVVADDEDWIVLDPVETSRALVNAVLEPYIQQFNEDEEVRSVLSILPVRYCSTVESDIRTTENIFLDIGREPDVMLAKKVGEDSAQPEIMSEVMVGDDKITVEDMERTLRLLHQICHEDGGVDLTEALLSNPGFDFHDSDEDDRASIGQAAMLELFGSKNRVGIPGTLHRIAPLVGNRNNRIIGLTIRVGRSIYGCSQMITDLLASSKESILLLGRPGIGKTSVLRDAALTLANAMRNRVVLVDTSNEIAGEGDTPHWCVGRSRRMQVPSRKQQHSRMIEAVENHAPEVLIIDAIGTRDECTAAMTVRHRGVRVIATAHGNEVVDIVRNPDLNVLTGRSETVIYSDQKTEEMGLKSKMQQHRRHEPVFDVIVELRARDQWVIHRNATSAVDAVLKRDSFTAEERRMFQTNDGGRAVEGRLITVVPS